MAVNRWRLRNGVFGWARAPESQRGSQRDSFFQSQRDVERGKSDNRRGKKNCTKKLSNFEFDLTN